MVNPKDVNTFALNLNKITMEGLNRYVKDLLTDNKIK